MKKIIKEGNGTMKEAINFMQVHNLAEAGEKAAWKILHQTLYTADRDPLAGEFARVRAHLKDPRTGKCREPQPDEYESALEEYSDLAARGCVDAIELLVKWYSAGIYVKQDYRKCFGLLDRLMQSGSRHAALRAKHDIMFCYANGIGTKQDLEKAYQLLCEMYKPGCPANNVFPFYDSERSRLLYPYDPVCEDFLNYCRLEKQDPRFECGYALYRCTDDAEKRTLLSKHAPHEFFCRFELGRAYRYGLYGLKKDAGAAFAHYRCAYEESYSYKGWPELDEMRLEIADCYGKGVGTAVDQGRCVAILTKIVGEYQNFEEGLKSDLYYAEEGDYYGIPTDDIPEVVRYRQLMQNKIFARYGSRIAKRMKLGEKWIMNVNEPMPVRKSKS